MLNPAQFVTPQAESINWRKTGLKKFLSEIFVWWQGQTWGTRLWIKRFGEFVGEDEFGNRYYQDKRANRRYVTYAGYADASTIPPGWHGWMHHRVDTPPSQETTSRATGRSRTSRT